MPKHGRKRSSSASEPDTNYQPTTTGKQEPITRDSKRSLQDPAKPTFKTANELLLSHDRGVHFYEKICERSSYLRIAASDAGDNAGSGLYLVAKPDEDLHLKANTPITWYSGELHYNDPDSEYQKNSSCYTVALGPVLKSASLKIISNPMNFNTLGCAHFINHSKKPNCKRGYVYDGIGIICVYVTLSKDTIVPAGHALELVINYGKSAITKHEIYGSSTYVPMPKPTSRLLGVKPAPSDTVTKPQERSDFYVPKSDSEIFAFPTPKKFSWVQLLTLPSKGTIMPKTHRQDYSAEEMTKLLKTIITPATCQIISNKRGKVSIPELDKTQETIFVVQIAVALDTYPWFVLYHDKPNERVFVFDPEGYTVDKFRELDFIPNQFRNKSVFFCDSWFAYSQYPAQLEYRRSGVIAVELAKMLQHLVQHNEAIRFTPVTNPPSSSARFNCSHIDLMVPPKFKELATLATPYKTKATSEHRDEALEQLIDEQNRLLATPTQVQGASLASAAAGANPLVKPPLPQQGPEVAFATPSQPHSVLFGESAFTAPAQLHTVAFAAQQSSSTNTGALGNVSCMWPQQMQSLPAAQTQYPANPFCSANDFPFWTENPADPLSVKLLELTSDEVIQALNSPSVQASAAISFFAPPKVDIRADVSELLVSHQELLNLTEPQIAMLMGRIDVTRAQEISKAFQQYRNAMTQLAPVETIQAELEKINELIPYPSRVAWTLFQLSNDCVVEGRLIRSKLFAMTEDQIQQVEHHATPSEISEILRLSQIYDASPRDSTPRIVQELIDNISVILSRGQQTTHHATLST